jgi:hypothetical protein
LRGLDVGKEIDFKLNRELQNRLERGKFINARSAHPIQDLLEAKRTLSRRLFKNHLSTIESARTHLIHISSAVKSAHGGVHSVGVGRKIVEGNPTNDLSVRLYVSQKIAHSVLSSGDRLPKSIEGIPVDVIETGAPYISSAARQRQRPAPAGISAAHRDVTAGTLSCYCRSTHRGDNANDVFALSNNHVFAKINQGLPGDHLYQQSPADGGGIGEHFADLHRFVPIHLGGNTPNRVDAAVGIVRDLSDISTIVSSIGSITGIIDHEEDMKVRKHGRTTGYTEGTIDDVSLDALVGMDHANPSLVALFQDQMRIIPNAPHSAFGLGGDSGSLVVHGSLPKAVGLYFAGPHGGAYGLANPISTVLSEMEIEILP